MTLKADEATAREIITRHQLLVWATKLPKNPGFTHVTEGFYDDFDFFKVTISAPDRGLELEGTYAARNHFKSGPGWWQKYSKKTVEGYEPPSDEIVSWMLGEALRFDDHERRWGYPEWDDTFHNGLCAQSFFQDLLGAPLPEVDLSAANDDGAAGGPRR